MSASLHDLRGQLRAARKRYRRARRAWVHGPPEPLAVRNARVRYYRAADLLHVAEESRWPLSLWRFEWLPSET